MATSVQKPYVPLNIENIGILSEDLYKERVNFFKEFLNQDYSENIYIPELKRLAQAGGGRFVVDIDQLREYDNDACEAILKQPSEYIPAFEAASTEIARGYLNKDKVPAAIGSSGADGFYIPMGFVGSFGEQHISPRKLGSDLLGKLVCIEGIVTRTSLVRPKVVRSVHYSEKKNAFYSKLYNDQTSSNNGFGTLNLENPVMNSSGYPKEDEEGNPLTTEYGLSYYANHQTINIQEMPERAPPGQLPRGVDVILDNDLVDSTKPGDRILVVGIYRALAGKNSASTSGVFRSLVLANSVRGFGASSLIWSGISEGSGGNSSSNKSSNGAAPVIPITDGDIKNIRSLSKRDDIVNILSNSLAPSGCEQNLDNGSHIRGDINMLMVGDPSTAKSQLLRYVLRIAPLAIATTGRGSSGVGLTAAVTTDKDTGERRLEAGAMVLADRGIVCIDEFDKMTDGDRVAIHEAMEQQTVTIAKAGIHATLNARCSVVAAANPIYGRYDPSRPPHQNIALPDSLLSRFDLLYIVTDVAEEEKDRELSLHVLNMHRYIPNGLDPGQPIDDLLDASSLTASANEDTDKSKDQILSTQFLRRYIYYAKSLFKPKLLKSSAEIIANAYANLRTHAAMASSGRRMGTPTTSPITPRTLETLIRLASAHAKARLSSEIEEIDANEAKALLSFALFRENIENAKQTNAAKQKSKKNDHKSKKLRTDYDNDDSDSSDIVDNQKNKSSEPSSSKVATKPKSKQLSKRSKKIKKSAAQKYKDLLHDDDDDADFDLYDSGEDSEELSAPSSPELLPARSKSNNNVYVEVQKGNVSDEDINSDVEMQSTEIVIKQLEPHRFEKFKTCFHAAISNGSLVTSDEGVGWSISNEIVVSVNKNLSSSDEEFTLEEVILALKSLQDENRVFISDDSVYMI
ncbi:hypothetical protein BB561_002120 [Smittium simulii]|uniref:DNA replication licensing factor MCM3 n=1 Tax=Smittium simulii TaxID=133385 RepID=A0A2T9YRM4_9FUNG|nr:hypothetical protein BB561_002120 [Smittium simulii]